MTRNLTVVDHPLIRHKLTLMRDKGTPSAVFRQLLREISLLLAYEVLRDLPTATKAIETPLGPMDAPIPQVQEAGVCVDPARGQRSPGRYARPGALGACRAYRRLYRDPATLSAVEYYLKMPEGLAERRVIAVDPMLGRPTRPRRHSAGSRTPAPGTSGSSACSPPRKGSKPSTRPTPTCISTRLRSTTVWTITATSFPVSAMRATGCTEPGRAPPAPPPGTSGSCAYITAPVCHGTNSLSPRPSASLLVLSPDATAIILSRISRPFCSIETPPSAISPQLISMSSVMLA